jgi:hypothetical protein
MSRLLTQLLLEDVSKDWDESKHPREHGRFASAGLDPQKIAEAARRAAMAGGKSKTVAAEARRHAAALGAPPAEAARLQGWARRAVRAQVGGAYAQRQSQAAAVREQFGRDKGGAKPKPAPEPDKSKVVPPPVSDRTEHLMNAVPTAEKIKQAGNINETRFVTFADGSKGVFKPDNTPSPHGVGENMTPYRQGSITPGNSVGREVAASQVAHLVGMDDMLPTTVERRFGSEGPVALQGRRGSLQDFASNSVPAEERGVSPPKPFDGAEDFARAAIFDHVIGNTDRHPGNWMLQDPHGANKIKLIDHGLSFPDHDHVVAVRGFMEAAGKDRDNQYHLGAVPTMTRSPSSYIGEYVRNKDAILNAVRSNGMSEKAVHGVATRIGNIAKWNSKDDWSNMHKGYQAAAARGGRPAPGGGGRAAPTDALRALERLLGGMRQQRRF